MLRSCMMNVCGLLFELLELNEMLKLSGLRCVLWMESRGSPA
jgi:hypothetical protein